MVYKKSYLGIILWFIGYMVTMGIVIALPIKGDLIFRVTYNWMTMGIAVLALIIYLTGNVYWYNGISYEDACKVGHERRKLYALKHLISFGVFAIIFLIFSIVMHILKVDELVDLVVAAVGIVVVAISTIRYKL